MTRRDPLVHRVGCTDTDPPNTHPVLDKVSHQPNMPTVLSSSARKGELPGPRPRRTFKLEWIQRQPAGQGDQKEAQGAGVLIPVPRAGAKVSGPLCIYN